MLRRSLIAAALAALAVAAAAPAALAGDARYEGISADGEVAFFSSFDKLVPGDTDTRRDVYERSFDADVEGYVTRQVTLGPLGGNNAFDAQYLGADAAGERVYFSTGERLTAADADKVTDIYVRDLAANTTTLVSAGDVACAGSGCGSAESAVSAVSGGIVADGDRVFFASLERLAADDTDDTADAYVRDLVAEETVLVSAADPSCEAGPCGNGAEAAFFQGASADGTVAFFTSEEALHGADEDALPDLYRRDLGEATTELVSLAGTCPPEADCTPIYGGASTDGSHVFFETRERAVEADEDALQDVYDWSEGALALASLGPDGGEAANARYVGRSADGGTVFFATSESLIEAGDTDTVEDVYARSAGASTVLVSAGAAACAGSGCGNGELPSTLRWVSPDGSTALISTAESLDEADADEAFDVYRRDLPAGPTTLVSRPDASCSLSECGEGEQNANFAGASADGSQVFFVTAEPQVDADEDSATDVYRRGGGATTLVSVGQINGNGPHNAQLHGVSADGDLAFFDSDERLTGEDDFAGEKDVYVRGPSGTLLVSVENDPELDLGPPAPQLLETDPASPAASLEPRVIGSSAESAAAIKIYTSADCSGEPVATGSAEELAEPGIPAAVEIEATTAFRATAEAEGFISACSDPPLLYTHQAPEPPPGEEEGGSGGGGSGDSGSGESSSGSSPAPSAGGSAPKTHSGGVAFVVPRTRITFGPAFKTRARRPGFRFTDATGQPGTRFICRVDRRRWRLCRSPVRLRGLRRGRHVFRVKAVNAVGAWEARVVRRRFRMTRSDRPRRGTRRASRQGQR